MPRKVLITGANGLLGQQLVKVFQGDYEVHALDLEPRAFVPGAIVSGERSHAPEKFTYHQGDITDRKRLRALVQALVPNFIINAAAFTDVDGSETRRELCWKVNVTGVENLAYAAQKIDARLIHISTDYVFDGKAGPYREHDRPNPLGFYGRSKLASENVLVSSNVNYAIARTMVLYGTGYEIRSNFVTWLLGRLRAGETVQIVDDQFGNPTLASELAGALRILAESGRNDIYHISGREVIDRYHFAIKVAEVFDLDPKLIQPVKTCELKQAAPRPLKSGFDISKAERELGITMSDVIGGLQKFKVELSAI
ncbi:MAG: dTDP-4-dehydrorhamnose reductase [candidate division KSB1 bacterium]|nr:dTDP-4-dehydrorhamnose reductase [candidate division KSB1 bacterium]MDZ7303376.1 dTDP-4-dehydrorhamnose reductase [candidate division KSB1 bacterium]MDZ7312306.1 dTDP-4-dehydrorhamnose reductase [candidate division KSB1 bacterium]